MTDEERREALLLMDKMDVLIRWACVSHPDASIYDEGAKAFWRVCRMLAENDAQPIAKG